MNDFEEWFYSASGNQFRKIIEAVYKIPLKTIDDKKRIFTEKGIAITDIILSAERSQQSNPDQNLINIHFNTEVIKGVLTQGNNKRVLFTSKFVERHFKKLIPSYGNIDCLPSPSPRYARISLQDKIEIYKEKLPE